ncbi:hypothetical protein MNBD_UNCLBAC01-133 [hydrothermal vent metagenome]|uniref:Uncharacterized protein n=1 Tax=hydrothermal vent metagenome TaxID=652676 RepID=A0A3B1DJB9_9ZZZZ
MNYSKILDELSAASLFELYRLKIAIGQQLDDPVRNKAIARQVKVGQEITWFDMDQNKLIEATIIKVRRTRVSVKNKCDGEIWNVSFYCLNLGNVEVAIDTKSFQKGISRNELKVGDQVGFVCRGEKDVYGEVIKLNPKRAVVHLYDGEKWNVRYRSLFRVIDGQKVIPEEERLSYQNSNVPLPMSTSFSKDGINWADEEVVDV